MGFKEQIKKIADNWLLIALVFVLLILPNMLFGISSITSYKTSNAAYDYSESYSGSLPSYQKSYSPGYGIYDNRDFAPDEADRKVMKTVSMSTEVNRGNFLEEETKLKAITESTGSFILSERVNKYGEKQNEYRVGYYTIKVEATKYDSVVIQLKAIGEVKSFNEDKEDITGQYTNAKIELETEKARLSRYNQMYKEATLVADKITLNDRIFDQERKIKYMEDAIENMDKTIEYSTLYFTMTEKRSDYADIVFVKFSELVKSLVASINAMASLLFTLAPWAILVGIIIAVKKRLGKKKN